MLKRTATAALAAGLTAAAFPASAQPACGDRGSLVSELGSLHNEAQVAAGMRDPQHLIELWATEDGATWTLLLSRADGYACVLGIGSDWSPVPGHEEIAGIGD